ncbi:hypothetical protein [Macrococcoides canis]|uniref:hypothetical protein n=1 Tax=Macrococcoides canis TaxID=1855823 RepID=UPI0022B906EF|nr:hypothetical protein [Macrococcus canis]WBF52126.1 hypothetical protein LL975_08445 [Macrococcus canis]
MKNKKDYFLSILSSALPIVFLQLILIPIYSHNNNQIQLGNFVIILAIVNITSVILGNSLNNIRLTNKDTSISESQFNSFLLILLCIQLLLNFLFAYFKEFDIYNVLIISCWSGVLLLKSYYLVFFRLKLDFYHYLISSIIYSIFIILSSFIVYKFNFNIYIILLLADFLSLLYILYKNKDYYGIKNISLLPIYKIKDFLSLTISNLLSNILNYSDRLFIDIILGSLFTPYFFIATTLGKLSNLIIAPINNVILSYSVRKEDKSKKNNEIKSVLNIIIIVTILNICMYFISIIFIDIFYHQYLDKVKDYIFMGNYSLMLLSGSTIPQVKLVANNRFRENLIVNLSIVLLLIILGVPLTYLEGINGFIWSLFIVSIFKFVIILYYLNKKIHY